jgi:acetyltransferase-like isoleucine patch superfamily enzyme
MSQASLRLHQVSWGILSIFGNLWLLLIGAKMESQIKLIGFPIVSGRRRSSIRFGKNVKLVSVSKGTSLGVSRRSIIRTLSADALIEIGDDTGLSGVTICSANRISIGERCLIGSDVMIVDTDFHPLAIQDRRYADRPTRNKNHEIEIGSDVFVGARTIILKGVQIGRGSVIGAGSVVTQSVPPGTVFAGNPAQFIKKL